MAVSYPGRQRVAVLWAVALLSSACYPVDREMGPLPERTLPADTAALPPDFDDHGGPVIMRLTGWGNPRVRVALESIGITPLPGYAQIERLDSIGMNTMGGTVPPGALGRLLGFRWIIAIEPAG